MPRIKIDLPEFLLTRVAIPVRITDINYGNHVGNDTFVAIVHEARLQWLSKHGYTELQCDGIGLIMGGLSIEFKQEAFYGDILEVEIFAGEVSRVNFDLYYRIVTHRSGEEVLIAKAHTSMVCFNYEQRKTVSIPVNLKQLLTPTH
jgi:YbgC/YbaW family acyl-CoA thioester hydrolase